MESCQLVACLVGEKMRKKRFIVVRLALRRAARVDINRDLNSITNKVRRLRPNEGGRLGLTCGLRILVTKIAI